MAKKVHQSKVKRIDPGLNDWVAGSRSDRNITAEQVFDCTPALAAELCEYIEDGMPLMTALDLAGVPISVYRDWEAKALEGTTPFKWFIVMLRKARASFLYSKVIDLNDPANDNWRRDLEVLKLADPNNWGGQQSTDDTSPIPEEFL